MKKVLIITYYWPPSGGAGVQRWLKFSRYLPDYGWEPVILTIDPNYAAYPAYDNSLEEEIPASLRVYKTKATDWYRIYVKDKSQVPSAGFAKDKEDNFIGKISRFIRGNFFIPDPRKGWNKHAYRKAVELIENEQIKHIITTSPPHSTQLIGLKLRKKFREITWIADFRDPWTDIYYYGKFYGTWPARWYDRKLERTVLNQADKITTIGNGLAELLSGKIINKAVNVKVISNGYDEEDFMYPVEKSSGKLHITYVGTLSDQYPIEPLIEAFKILEERNIEFELVLAGQFPTSVKTMFLSKLHQDSVNFIEYISHGEAIKVMSSASVLLLLIPDQKGNELIITGKLFEYLRTGIPILLVGPEEGDAASIIKECGAGRVFSKTDISGIVEYLSSDAIGLIKYEVPSRYERRSLAALLSKEIG